MNDLAAKSAKGAKKGETWPMVRLGDVCELKGGFAFKSSEYTTEGLQVVRISDLCNEYISNDNAVYYPEDKSLERYVIEEDCILICLTGSIGKMSLVCDGVRRYLNQRVGLLICNSRVLINYAWHFLHTERVLLSWENAKTSVNGNLRNSDITELQIPLPPLEVQKEIVERLEKELDECEKIAENFRKIAELAEAEFKAVLDEVFGELEGMCVREGEGEGEGEGKGEGEGEGEGDILTQRSREAEVRRVRLGDLGEIKRGKGIKRSETVLKGLPCVRYGEIYTSYNYVLDEPKSFISVELFDNCVHINQDDLVFTLTGENREEIAKTLAYLGKDIIAAGGDMAVWTNHGCVAMYLAYLMYSSQMIKAKAEASNGQIIVHASVKKLEEIQIPLPSLSVQESVVTRLDEARGRCDKLKVAAERGLRAAENLRKAILAEAFE